MASAGSGRGGEGSFPPPRCFILTFIVLCSKCTARPSSSAVSSSLSLFYAPSAPPAQRPALSHPHFHCLTLQVHRQPNIQRCLILTFIVLCSRCPARPSSSAVSSSLSLFDAPSAPPAQHPALFHPQFHCFMLQVPRPPVIQRCLILNLIV